MKTTKILLALYICLLQYNTVAQDTLNRVNVYGQKYGYWKIFGNLSQYYHLEPLTEKPRDKNDTLLLEEGFYLSGFKTGMWKSYFPNGKLASQEEYKNGQRCGKFVYYYENGCLSEDGGFQNHAYFGKCRRYSKDTCGKVIKIRFDEPGPATLTPQYNHQLYKAQHSKANKNCLPEVVPDGQHTYYYTDKTICQEGEFKNGRLFNGKWYKYDSENWLVKILVYQQGECVGNEPLE